MGENTTLRSYLNYCSIAMEEDGNSYDVEALVSRSNHETFFFYIVVIVAAEQRRLSTLTQSCVMVSGWIITTTSCIFVGIFESCVEYVHEGRQRWMRSSSCVPMFFNDLFPIMGC